MIQIFAVALILYLNKNNHLISMHYCTTSTVSSVGISNISKYLFWRCLKPLLPQQQVFTDRLDARAFLPEGSFGIYQLHL